MSTNKKLQLERLNAVLSAIESNIEQFDMSCYEEVKACGTVRCIAGWTIHIFLKRQFIIDYDSADIINAANILGLSADTADSLFFLEEEPYFNWSHLSIKLYGKYGAIEGLSRLKQLISHIESSDEESLVEYGICDYSNINITDYA